MEPALIGVIVTLAIQIGTLIWGAAHLAARVKAHTDGQQALTRRLDELEKTVARRIDELSGCVNKLITRIAVLEDRDAREATR